MTPEPPKSIPRSLAGAVGSLPKPMRVNRPPPWVTPKVTHGSSTRPPFSQPRLVVLPHPARFDPARLVAGIPQKRTRPATVAGRLGSISAGVAARLGGFRPGKR